MSRRRGPRPNRTRPWRVEYTYPGVRRTDPDTGIAYVDHRTPVSGVSTHPTEDQARFTAEGITQRGGTVVLAHVDRATGTRTVVDHLGPAPLTLAELAGQNCDGTGRCPERIEHDPACLAHWVRPDDDGTPGDVELQLRRELAALVDGQDRP